ncbi:MAG: hypothetical protein LBQ58_00550 [Synergistaceae bacterium]|jgi:hypothetical protein|nr:hypothetical protein [Synergistaceae bacterium]
MIINRKIWHVVIAAILILRFAGYSAGAESNPDSSPKAPEFNAYFGK